MLSLLLASFVTFFVAIDPVAMAPMFTTMTGRMTPAWRRQMAWKSVAIATLILLAFAFGGAWLLAQIHVSIDAFRIAGGLLLFLIAVDMLFEKRSERRDERAEKVAAAQAEHPEHQDDIS
ncbi:MAG: MarC family protein, partial [Hyphomonadaceae bacterium]